MASHVSVVNWGRARDTELKRRLQEIDPNNKSPLTAAEIRGLSKSQLAELDELFDSLRDAGLISQTRQKNYPVEKSGPLGYPEIDEALGLGSTREFTDGATVVSEINEVRPVLSDTLAAEGDRTFDQSVVETIANAKRFVAITAFGFDREDIVDLLIEKAKSGVEVAVLVDPANEPKESRKGEMLDKLRKAGLKNLKVAEYPIAEARHDGEFDQIMHVKKLIADTGDGGMVDLSGGINYGETSTKNIDLALETEGVAALDSMREFLRRYHFATGELPFDVAKTVPDEKTVEAAIKKKLGKKKPTRVELGGTDRQLVGEPPKWTPKKLQRAAADSEPITISSSQAGQPGVAKALQTALHNGSRVRIVEEPMKALDTATYRKVRDLLRAEGAETIPHDGTYLESSYHYLVLRELKRAIENGESIDVAAFALSDQETIQALIDAHDAGCKVRVLVDSLTIEGFTVNRKAIAQLSAAGVPIRGFDPSVAEKFSEETGVPAEQIKLHSKLIVLGGNRVLNGSANFSASGFNSNVETGRLVNHEGLAKTVTKSFMDPTWKKASELQGVETVPYEKRVPLTEPPKVDAKIEDVIFLVFDFETTGFVPGHDERILSLSFEARRYKPNGEFEVVDGYKSFVDPGTDAFGRPFEIPQRAVEVHGLDRKKLEELGAKPMREVAPKVIELVQRLKEEGPVVPTGQNVAFDLRFLDFFLSRPELAGKHDGKKANFRVEAPFVDTAQVSSKVFPKSFAHDLDAIMKRLKIEPRKDLPRHDAHADVVYTGDALGKLIAKGGLKRFGELLGDDRIEILEPMEIWAKPKGGDSGYRLEFNDHGSLIVVLEDESDDPTRVVNDLEVLGVEGTSVEIKATISWKGEDREVEGFVDGNRIGFRAPGVAYEKLRAAGVAVPVPSILS